jgi:diacylglycerol kinase (ATP)
MNPKRALFIVNALARKGLTDLEGAREILREGGIDSQLFIFDHVRQIRGAIHRHRHKADIIIVGGGDGTLNAAAEPILAAGLPLGILPLGTANDLARTLQIPADPERAVKVITAGRTKNIDVGWVNHKYFFNVASIGMAVKVSHELTAAQKRRWGVLAYVMGAWKAYQSTRPFGAVIICDGRSQRLKSIQIAIGNGRHYGGGMSIRHDAAIDDHTLNLYSLEPQPKWRLIQSAPAIIRGIMAQNDFIHSMDGQEIKVITRKPMPIDTDGEITAYTPGLFRVLKERLPVFVP